MDINVTEEIKGSERDLQRQWEEDKIENARYNRNYKKVKMDGDGPDYLSENLRKFGIGDKIRALIKLRCGNLEENNKYWLEEEKKICLFGSKGTDDTRHYLLDCKSTLIQMAKD